MKVVIITQARLNSNRLPQKVLKKIGGKSLLQIHLDRVGQTTITDDIILATTTNPADEVIYKLGQELNLKSTRGSEDNVLDRFYQACKKMNPDYVVRITSDCPLLDPRLIDEIFQKTVELNVDYCSNTLNPTYPDGQDVEVMKFSALEKAWNEANLVSEKEHVTPYIWKNSDFKGGDLFTSHSFENNEDFGHLRMTVDEPEDFEVIEKLIGKVGENEEWKTYADLLMKDQEIRQINERFARNEGYVKSIKEDNNE